MGDKTLLICKYCDNKMYIDMYYEWQSVPTRCEICRHPELIKRTMEDGRDAYGYKSDEEYYERFKK